MSELLIDNVIVFDGVSAPERSPRSVRISGERIVEIGRCGAGRPGDAKIDGRSMTLMPGLIDAHFHCNAPSLNVPASDRLAPSHLAQYARKYLEEMLSRGFTTVRDAGGADVGLVRALDEGLIRGPRLLVSGRALSQTGGHGDLAGPRVCGCRTYSGTISCVVDGVEAVHANVREQLRDGVNQIKLFVSGGVLSPSDPIWMDQFTDTEISAAVEEARRWRTYVMAHALTDASSRRCAELGVRSIEHGIGITRETAKFIADKGTYVVPTLGILHWLQVDQTNIPPASREKLKQVGAAATEALRNCHAAGVKVGFGTDLLGELHGREAEELVLRSRVSGPLETLRSATSVNAELINRSGELGVIAQGAYADLLLVDGDPIADIGLLTRPERSLKLILKSGESVKNTL